MQCNPATRVMKTLMRCMGRWLIVAAFADMAHASGLAATAQVDIKSLPKAMQSPSMDSCPRCAACQLAPGFETNMTGSGDLPEQVASLMWTQDAPRHMSQNAIRPAIALRIRYCRWLN